MIEYKNKDFKNKKVIAIGYCQAQSLLCNTKKIGYTKGVYGWNSDIYNINDIYISTGYRPIKSDIPYNNDILKKYEDKARVILTSDIIDYKLKYVKIDKLLHDFIKKISEV